MTIAFLLTATITANSEPESRPGPEILYRPLASSPQLANVAPWQAAPILISGVSAYRKGEFLYQDYLYDDYGANNGAGSYTRGTYTYPTDPRYARNAADFVEIRLKPLVNSTAVRITYNTLYDPALVATTIALGTSPMSYELPHGANARAPAEVFVTIHGTTADIVDAATGQQRIGPSPTVSVNLDNRQVDVRIPYEAFDPRDKVVRVAAATGLWDDANDKYLIPISGDATAVLPGGAGTLIKPPAFFNVAFRYTEPARWENSKTWAEVVAKNRSGSSIWREQQQADVLATGDISPFFANVDFSKLARRADDDLLGQPQGAPRTGFMSRILVSHFESAQGRGDIPTWFQGFIKNCTQPPCTPQLAGRLQPYGIYVPTRPPPPAGYGLTIELHAVDGTYSYFADTPRAILLGKRGGGSIVISPEGRGSRQWYGGHSAADIFEAWADVAARYPINADNVMIMGNSMGSYGAYKMAALFPDLFIATTTSIPCPLETRESILPLVASYRHVPIFSWNMIQDESCPYRVARTMGDKLTALGYRHEFLSAIGTHAIGGTAAMEDYSMIVGWLERLRLIRDPAHVTYVMNADMSEPELGLNADHAYWISNLQLRDATAHPLGSVDVFSHGFGLGDPPALPSSITDGVLTTTSAPFKYMLESHELGPAPSIPVRNRLDITVRNIRGFTIDPARARVNCGSEINVDTDGYVEIKLKGCQKIVTYGVKQ